MYHCYCSLCGVVLSLYGDASPPSAPLPWSSEARAVRLAPPHGGSPLSGVGVVNEAGFRASFDPSVSYKNNFQALEEHAHRRRPNATTYLFHDACWKLLASRLSSELGGSNSDVSAERLAVSLYYFLRCIPKDRRGALLVAHGYGGAASLRSSFGFPGTGYERSLPEDRQFLIADPGDCVTEQILAYLPTFSTSLLGYPSYASDAGRHPNSPRMDPFRRLPPEILGLILVRLASADLCNLRLASAAVARVSSPMSLSQAFWESRFKADSEMAFFFSGLPLPANSNHIDWRALYALIRKSLKVGPPSAGLRNRLRIWQCLNYVVCSLKPLLQLNNHNWLQMYISSRTDLLPEHQRVSAAVQSHAQHEHAAQYLPFQGPTGVSRLYLSVYFMDFNCRLYISGVALRYRDGDEYFRLRQVGISTETEELFEFGEGDVVSEVNVYSAADGIVGLEFWLRGTSERIRLGLCSGSSSDVAVAGMRPTEPGRLRGLMLTFDACKCTGVRLVESVSVDESPQATESNNDIPASEPPRHTLWKPDILEGKEVPLSSPRPASPNICSKRSPVRINMSFGGVCGEKLPFLNRIVALFDGYYSLFKGFIFFYDDGTRASYGTSLSVDSISSSRFCIEMSFRLYGKQGERVTEIHAIHEAIHRPDHIRGLLFYTNWGSKLPFVTHWKAEALELPQPFAIFKPGDGNSLTGLVAELTDIDGTPDFNGAFRAIGAVTAPGVHPARQPETCRPSPAAIAISECQFEVALHMTPQHRACFTTTSLTGVRRIRFSAGVAGSARSDQCVSGLLLQFHGSEREHIVGQWFEEVGVLNIGKEDYITHIRVWYTQEAREGNTLCGNNGKISGVMMSTLKGASKTVLRGDPKEMLCHEYYSNPLEHIDGVIWSFNALFDHMKVLRVRTPRYDGKALQFEPPMHWEPRTYHDLRRLLWVEIDRDGNEVPLSTIQAFFDAERRLTGVRFVYNADTERDMGICVGERVAASLGEDEVPVVMDADILVRPGTPGNIIVLYTVREGELRRHSLHHPDTEVAAAGQRFVRHILESEHELPPTSNVNIDMTVNVYRRQNAGGRCVGIWGTGRTFPKADPRILYLGPLFVY